MVSLRIKQRNVCCFRTILVSIKHSISDHVGTYKNLTLKSANENQKKNNNKVQILQKK